MQGDEMHIFTALQYKHQRLLEIPCAVLETIIVSCSVLYNCLTKNYLGTYLERKSHPNQVFLYCSPFIYRNTSKFL